MNQQYDLKDYKFPQIKSRDWKKVITNPHNNKKFIKANFVKGG